MIWNRLFLGFPWAIRKVSAFKVAHLLIASAILVTIIFFFVFQFSLFQLRNSMRNDVALAIEKDTLAFEIEINVIGLGLGVLKYLGTGEKIYLKRVDEDSRELTEFIDRFQELAITDYEKILAQRVSKMHYEYRQTAYAVIAQSDQVKAKTDTVLALFNRFEMRHSLRDHVNELEACFHENPANELEYQACLRMVENLEFKIRDLGWSGVPTHSGGYEMSESTAAIRETLSLKWNLSKLTDKLIRLRVDLDNLLDEEIQLTTNHSVLDSQKKLRETGRKLGWVFLFFTSLLFLSWLVIAWFTRTINGGITGLIQHAKQVGDGQFEKPVQVEFPSELAQLSDAMNKMRLELLHTMVSKTALEKSEAHLKKTATELDYLVHHDPLTGLANRVKFYLELVAALEKAQRQDTLVALFFINIDHFKEINDTLGFHNGDFLLKEMGQRLVEVLADRGLVASFGGDEFAVSVIDIGSADQVGLIAEQIQSCLRSKFEMDDFSLEVTASIGVVLYPQHGENADALIRRADITMSIAKKSDASHVIYNPQLDNFSPRRLMLLGELREAIAHNKLNLFFQPKIDMKLGKVSGVEALLRWDHPKFGTIHPDEFIPIAERSGLIKSLTLWVLEHGVNQWAQWYNEGIDILVAVNLSARDLFDESMPDQIAQILAKFGMPPSRLALEITESAMMEDPKKAQFILSQLSKMGIQLAIDDFGKGYSSLAYLKNLPVGNIKIDKSFVTQMVGDENDQKIVQTTIELGHAMGLKVIAEGVEDENTWALLSQWNCDFVQGFYMSKPEPASKLKPWLLNSRWGLHLG